MALPCRLKRDEALGCAPGAGFAHKKTLLSHSDQRLASSGWNKPTFVLLSLRGQSPEPRAQAYENPSRNGRAEPLPHIKWQSRRVRNCL
jgi:hypothetical protein